MNKHRGFYTMEERTKAACRYWPPFLCDTFLPAMFRHPYDALCPRHTPDAYARVAAHRLDRSNACLT